MTWRLPLAALVAGLALAGCLGVGAESDMASQATVDATTLEPGQWVNVTYEVENQGDAPYTYRHPGCPPAPVVADADGPGGTVALYQYREESQAGTCMVREVTVDPGGTVEGTVNWNGHRTEEAPDPHGGERLPAGDYQVTVELSRADDGPGFPADVTVTLEE